VAALVVLPVMMVHLAAAVLDLVMPAVVRAITLARRRGAEG
jgi:hypothetical protein